MLDLGKDIRSLTAFKRNSFEFLKRLRETGNPLVLTVNGKAELIVQHVAPYQQLVEQAERAIEGAPVRPHTHVPPRKRNGK